MTEKSTVIQHCSECAYWEEINAKIGFCRANSPGHGTSTDEVAHWPETAAYEGCAGGVLRGVQIDPVVRCGDCVFWHQPIEGEGLTPQDRKDRSSRWWEQAGHCRRRPPYPSSYPGHRGYWRVTNQEDGCVEGCKAAK
jgi:hypothetical protein